MEVLLGWERSGWPQLKEPRGPLRRPNWPRDSLNRPPVILPLATPLVRATPPLRNHPLPNLQRYPALRVIRAKGNRPQKVEAKAGKISCVNRGERERFRTTGAQSVLPLTEGEKVRN